MNLLVVCLAANHSNSLFLFGVHIVLAIYAIQIECHHVNFPNRLDIDVHSIIYHLRSIAWSLQHLIVPKIYALNSPLRWHTVNALRFRCAHARALRKFLEHFLRVDQRL